MSEDRTTNVCDLECARGRFSQCNKNIYRDFIPNHLLPEIYNLSGKGMYEMFVKCNDKVADGSLSFMNLFKEGINSSKVDELKKEFEQELHPQMNPTHAKRLMEVIMTKAENILRKGRSYQQHLEDLRSVLTNNVNKFVQMYVLNKYQQNIIIYGTKEHNNAGWDELSMLLQRSVCGDGGGKHAARVYYKKLYEEEVKEFKTECQKKSLTDLAGFENSFIKSKFKVCEDFGVLAGNQNLVYPIWLMEKDKLKEVIDEECLKRVEALTKEYDSETEMKDWLKRVKRKQYEYFEASTLFKSDIKVNSITINNKLLMQRKIGYALYGPPSQNEDSNLEGVMKNLFSSNKKGELGYSISQQEKINSIYEKVVKLSKTDSVVLRCTFITYCIINKAKIDNNKGDKADIDNEKDVKDVTVPIFSIQDLLGNIFFLDSNARVYETWADFSTSNTLPSVTYCYPCNCIYDKSVGFR